MLLDDGFAVAARRDAALADLSRGLAQLRPEDRMAVVALTTGGPRMLSDWTADTMVLRRAFEQARQLPARGGQVLAQARSLLADDDLVASIPDDGESGQFAGGMTNGGVLEALRIRPSAEAVSQLHASADAAALDARFAGADDARAIAGEDFPGDQGLCGR